MVILKFGVCTMDTSRHCAALDLLRVTRTCDVGSLNIFEHL